MSNTTSDAIIVVNATAGLTHQIAALARDVYTVDWGDGTITEAGPRIEPDKPVHTYETAGEYTITLSGPEVYVAMLGENTKSVILPSHQDSISDLSFAQFASDTLETITLLSTTPPYLSFDPFAECTALKAIYVPAESVSAYKSASGWSDHADIISNIKITINEHIATITLNGYTEVIFSRQHPVYGIYGEDIKASFEEDFEDTDQGVYNTSATGTTIMENHQQKNKIYLKGTGTVTVWAGLSAVNFPFKAQGKGGGSGGGGTIYRTTTPLTDGATTNPITVNGESVTVKSGDFAIYNKAEFIFDGTQWDELGDTSGLGDLAYKDSATGTASISVTGTPDGSVTITPTKETIYSTTNKGTLPSFTYNSSTEELAFNAGTLPSTTSKSVVTNATATFAGTSTTSTGTVSVTVT